MSGHGDVDLAQGIAHYYLPNHSVLQSSSFSVVACEIQGERVKISPNIQSVFGSSFREKYSYIMFGFRHLISPNRHRHLRFRPPLPLPPPLQPPQALPLALLQSTAPSDKGTPTVTITFIWAPHMNQLKCTTAMDNNRQDPADQKDSQYTKN